MVPETLYLISWYLHGIPYPTPGVLLPITGFLISKAEHYIGLLISSNQKTRFYCSGTFAEVYANLRNPPHDYVIYRSQFHHILATLLLSHRLVEKLLSSDHWRVGKQMNDAEFLGCVYEVVRMKHWVGLPSPPLSLHSSAQLHTTLQHHPDSVALTSFAHAGFYVLYTLYLLLLLLLLTAQYCTLLITLSFLSK